MMTRSDDLMGRRPRSKNRRGFAGVVAEDEIRKRYVGKSVTKYFKRGPKNPVKYVNCN